MLRNRPGSGPVVNPLRKSQVRHGPSAIIDSCIDADRELLILLKQRKLLELAERRVQVMCLIGRLEID